MKNILWLQIWSLTINSQCCRYGFNRTAVAVHTKPLRNSQTLWLMYIFCMNPGEVFCLFHFGFCSCLLVCFRARVQAGQTKRWLPEEQHVWIRESPTEDSRCGETERNEGNNIDQTHETAQADRRLRDPPRNTACTMLVWNVLSRCHTRDSFLSTASCSESLASYAGRTQENTQLESHYKIIPTALMDTAPSQVEW